MTGTKHVLSIQFKVRQKIWIILLNSYEWLINIFLPNTNKLCYRTLLCDNKVRKNTTTTHLLHCDIPEYHSHLVVFYCSHHFRGYNQQNKQCYQHSQYVDNLVCHNHWDVSYCSRRSLGYNNIENKLPRFTYSSDITTIQ